MWALSARYAQRCAPARHKPNVVRTTLRCRLTSQQENRPPSRRDHFSGSRSDRVFLSSLAIRVPSSVDAHLGVIHRLPRLGAIRCLPSREKEVCVFLAGGVHSVSTASVKDCSRTTSIW